MGYVAAGNSKPEAVEMNFKDGPHRVHEAVVEHLGGPELLKKSVDMFQDKTYREFMAGYHKLVERDQIKRSFDAFIGGHFMGMGGF